MNTIKSFEDLYGYEEHPGQEIVDQFVEFVFNSINNESIYITLEKLEILGDKQYHIYDVPSVETKMKIQKWLIMNWTETDEFLESTLLILRNFSMDKVLYSKALECYNGEFKPEFIEELDNSIGENIDPWWDLRGDNK